MLLNVSKSDLADTKMVESPSMAVVAAVTMQVTVTGTLDRGNAARPVGRLHGRTAIVMTAIVGRIMEETLVLAAAVAVAAVVVLLRGLVVAEVMIIMAVDMVDQRRLHPTVTEGALLHGIDPVVVVIVVVLRQLQLDQVKVEAAMAMVIRGLTPDTGIRIRATRLLQAWVLLRA